MGILWRFSYKEASSKLRYLGCALVRQWKWSHEIWVNPNHKDFPVLWDFVIPRKNKDINEFTLKAILKQADISQQDFLDA